MKKRNLKIILIITLSIIIILLNKVSKASNEYTQINPVYNKIFTKEEKQYVLDKLEETSEQTNQNLRLYNSAIIYTNSNYSKLIKEVQNNLLKRNITINVMYKTNSSDAKTTVTKIIKDAFSEKYATSSNLGDYILWNSSGWKANYTYYKSGSDYIYNIKYTMNYLTNYEQEQKVTDAIDNYLYIYNTSDKTKYEIISDFNEYICQNVEYDNDNSNTYLLKYSTYAAIIDHKAVCQGYSTLYYRLLKECGINNRIVTSNKLNHAWNLVNYGCFWYHVDTTWNDTYYPYTKHFMKSIKDFGHGDLADAEPATNEYRVATMSMTQNLATEIETEENHKHEIIQKVNSTCGKEGYTINKCTICQSTYKVTIPALKHNYKTISIKKATTSNSGSITKKCSNCGASNTSKILKISSVKLNTTSYTYTGTSKTPKVTIKRSNGEILPSKYYTVTYPTGRKNVGTYKVKISFKDLYSGTKTLSFTIKPKTTSISKITSGSKKFKINWKKQKVQTTGYQIQYSRNSNFKKSKNITISKNKTTSKVISKLSSKKKYYARIRTYKTINGKRYYSNWSSKKAITTKK